MFSHLRGRMPGFLDSDRYRRYAVMVPYLPERDALLFEVRAGSLHRQPGEICFPGGRIERGETPIEAGLRETREELLVSRGQIEVIAPLDILLSPYHQVIHPHLIVLRDYKGTFSAGEVEETFSVSLTTLREIQPICYENTVSVGPSDAHFPYYLIGREDYPWGTSRYPVYFYPVEGRVIWGITARFIHNFLTLCGN